ncbi:hypothetical protein [Heliomicrobium undosum]|nr:hypothetical protein [Heliomicrobium undosum]
MFEWFFTDDIAQHKMEQMLKVKSLETSQISELKKPWKFGS